MLIIKYPLYATYVRLGSPYGGTAIIAGKDKTQTQQKRCHYTRI
jgi:hypothetical protein